VTPDRCLQLAKQISSNRLAMGEPSIEIEAGPTDAKIPTCLADITNLVSVLEHPQLVVHIAPEFVHPDHPSCF
jgi:hypothetical protein